MSGTCDIFLSHSGAQKEFVELLNAELGRVCGQYSVFFDRHTIQHGDQISKIILDSAKTCKLAVAMLSEEYFTRTKWPMIELAASYTAAKDGNGVPCLFPVFFLLKPEDAKNHNVQLEWQRTWQKWEVNDKMSERSKSWPSSVQLTVWKEAVDKLLDTSGPIYKPHENEYEPKIFLKKLALLIARKLDVLSRSSQPDEEVDCNKTTGLEELWTSVSTTMVSAEIPLIEELADEEVIPEPARGYGVVVCLEFGTTSSMFAFAHVAQPDDIYTHFDYPRRERPSCRTLTGIYYYRGLHEGQLHQVKAWGDLARVQYERDEALARKSSEHTVGTFVIRFNPHLTSGDMQISPRQGSWLPVERPITDYLHEMGRYILRVLQIKYGDHLTMQMIQWCVPVPSSWDNAAKEKMKTCMEAAGLLHGADGSPYPVKMVSALEAESFHSFRSCSSLQCEVGDKLMVVDIGERTFNVVVQEVVFVCKHVFKVKEVTSSVFTRNASLVSRKFFEILERNMGPCMQEFLMKCPFDGLFTEPWNDWKNYFGSGVMIREDLDIPLPSRLASEWESYDRMMGYPERESYDEITISYLEIQELFDAVIDETLNGIYDQYNKVDGVRGGVKALVLVGDSLVGSPYVMSNIKQKLSRLVPEIISPINPQSAAGLGAVALALDLCNCAGSTSS